MRTGAISLAVGTSSSTAFNTTNERWIMNDGSHIYASTASGSYNNKIWTDSNDGSGSGLDADLLDGLQGSVYMNKGSSSSYYQPDNWIDFNTTNVGLYWAGSTSAGWHIYPADAGSMRFRTAGNTCALRLDTNNGTARGSVYADNGNNIGFLNLSGSWRLKCPSSGSLLRDGTQTIWDSGNDGAGSGLDADTLDGVQGANFLRSDTNDTFTGVLTISGSISNASTAGNSGAILGNLEVGYGGPYNSISARNNNDLHLNYNSSGTVFVGASNTVWHAGNDGSGSGLDADTLDGLHASSFITSTSATTFTGNLTISKADAKLKLYSTDTSTPNYPGIDFDTANNQGVTLECNIFDSELPIAGLGLVVKKSATNTETGTLTFNVLGDIYTGGTSLSTVNKVLTSNIDTNITFDDSTERKININTEDLIFWDNTNNKQVARVHYGNNSNSGSGARGNSVFVAGETARTNYTTIYGGVGLLVEGRSDLDGCFVHGGRSFGNPPTRCTAVGQQAITFTTSTGDDNSALGALALHGVLDGHDNSAVGVWAGSDEQHGDYNVFVGAMCASHADDENYRNTVVGGYAGYDLNANDTVLIGAYSAYNQDQPDSDKNTYVGAYTAYDKRKGSNNTLIGYEAGRYLQNGNADNSTSSYYTNTTCLGYDSRISGSNQLQLGNSSTTSYAYGSVQNRSDARDKTDIRPTILGLDFIKKLNPVDFRWDYRDDYTEFVTVEKTKPSPIEIENPDGVEPPIIKSFEDVTETIAELHPISKDGSKARTRFHHGLIAQDVKTVMDELDIDFAGYQDHNMKDGLDVLSIGYTELIGPMIKAIQEQQAQIEALTAMIESMK